MDQSGTDAEGQDTYNSPQDLWTKVDANKATAWYGAAVAYWDKQEASDDGVLGGHGDVSGVDVEESDKLLQRAFGQQMKAATASGEQLVVLDCGAGVGRVTQQLLLHHFDEVDLLEPSVHLLETAKRRLSGQEASTRQQNGSHQRRGRAVNFFNCGLQSFEFTEQRYNVIWVQWALLYLTDDDAISFFARCRAGLKPGGIIVLKENICTKGFVVDKEDASLTRSNAYMLQLFARAKMQVLLNVQQRKFPKDLFKVRMYVLKHADL